MGDARTPSYRTFVRGILAWCTLSVLSQAAAAQIAPPHRPIRFERSDVEPFLPQSSVYAIRQDRHGFLWFGTREGLGRWDGYEMRTWKARPFANDALPDNVVRQILEDRDGSLWVVVVPDNFESSRVARLVGPDHARVETLAIGNAVPVLDGEGVAWLIGPDSLYRFDADSGRPVATRPRLRPGLVASGALIDRSGTLWVGTSEGALERYPPAGGPASVIAYPAGEPGTNRFQQFLEDAAGTIWITGRGLRRLDPTRSRVETIPAGPAVFDSTGTADILQDPDGWIWLGTLDGVYRFDPALTRVERFPLRLPGGIATQNWVVGLLRDQAGSIWAGTVWGLHRYDPADEGFGFVGHDPDDPNSLSSGVVLPILEDVTGAIWVGSLGGGVNRIDRQTGQVRRFRSEPGNPASLTHDWVWSLADAGDGRVWAGTERGLSRIDPAARPAVRRMPLAIPPGAPSGGVHALVPDSSGGLWVGTAGWLLRLLPDGSARPAELPFIGTMHTLLRDGRALWIGTSVGLVRFVPDSGTHTWFRHEPGRPGSLGHDVVLALHRDRAGRLWVGTNSGLNRFEPAGGQFVQYTEADGLPSAVIYSILEADGGQFWLGTNRGLVRFDPAGPAGQRLRHYDVTAGTGNVEFNRGAGLRGRDGTFYFGGDRGLTVFHPDELSDNRFIPPVVLTGVQRVSRAGVRLARHVPAGQPIVLAPDDYTVTFTFAALNFTHPERNQYAYRMEDVDPQWIAAGTTRTASYTNLPPGEYRFRVRGSNDDGIWNEAGLAVTVVVQPWFWETVWFRGLLLIAAVGLVSAGTATAQRARHRRQLEALAYQQALEGERTRISRDMHDEVGAGLTEIAMLSEMALRRDGDPPGQAPPVRRIADRSRAMLAAIGEIIWAINPEHDHAARLAPYLREYASEFLESAGLEARLHFEASTWGGPVHADFRRNLFLILKEALANAVRHADARRVSVVLEADAAGLRLRVEDDGRGFAASAGADSESRGHHGLANLRRRAAAIGGVLEITSAPGAGTRVTLAVPAGAVTRTPDGEAG